MNPTNTDLHSYTFQNHILRTFIDEQGMPWLIAKEVADILEYSDAFKMTNKLDDDEKSNLQIVGLGSPTGGRGTTIINESGLYAAIITSQKPAAKRFKKWVTSEVLPSIRKTGSYHLADEPVYKETITISKDSYIHLLETIQELHEEVDRRKQKRKPWTATDEARLRARHAEGLSTAEIAKLLGRSVQSVETRFYHLKIKVAI